MALVTQTYEWGFPEVLIDHRRFPCATRRAREPNSDVAVEDQY